MAPHATELLLQQWLRLDPNPESRQAMIDLRDRGAWSELTSRLTPRIAFGTAGLRARMQPGFARMNEVTVAQATQGLCEYMLQNVPEVLHKGVVVGHVGVILSKFGQV